MRVKFPRPAIASRLVPWLRSLARYRGGAGGGTVPAVGEVDPGLAGKANKIGRPDRRPGMRYECSWFRDTTGDGIPLLVWAIGHLAFIFALAVALMFGYAAGWHIAAGIGAGSALLLKLARDWISRRVYVTVNALSEAGPVFWDEPLREWWDKPAKFWAPNEDNGRREIIGFVTDRSWRGLESMVPCGESLLQVQGYSSSDFFEDLDNTATRRRKERKRGGISGRQQISMALLAGTAIALFLVAASE